MAGSVGCTALQCAALNGTYSCGGATSSQPITGIWLCNWNYTGTSGCSSLLNVLVRLWFNNSGSPFTFNGTGSCSGSGVSVASGNSLVIVEISMSTGGSSGLSGFFYAPVSGQTTCTPSPATPTFNCQSGGTALACDVSGATVGVTW
jgi:hypothetical protein